MVDTIDVNFQLIIFEKFLDQVHILLNLLFVKPVSLLSILICESPDFFPGKSSWPLFILSELRVLLLENLDSPVPKSIFELKH